MTSGGDRDGFLQVRAATLTVVADLVHLRVDEEQFVLRQRCVHQHVDLPEVCLEGADHNAGFRCLRAKPLRSREEGRDLALAPR